jgi:4-hydroxy-2-oxoheptanedioate aldolase
MLVMLIVETREAVDNLEAIAAVPGIDALYLGPFDLCLSLGLNPMQQPFPEVDAVIERMLAVGRKFGVAAGMGVNTPDQLRQRLSQGFTMLAYGSDYAILASGARVGLDAFGRR